MWSSPEEKVSMSEPTIDAEAFRHFERTSHDRIADSYQTFFEPVTQHAIAPLLDTAHVGAGTHPAPGAIDRGAAGSRGHAAS